MEVGWNGAAAESGCASLCVSSSLARSFEVEQLEPASREPRFGGGVNACGRAKRSASPWRRARACARLRTSEKTLGKSREPLLTPTPPISSPPERRCRGWRQEPYPELRNSYRTERTSEHLTEPDMPGRSSREGTVNRRVVGSSPTRGVNESPPNGGSLLGASLRWRAVSRNMSRGRCSQLSGAPLACRWRAGDRKTASARSSRSARITLDKIAAPIGAGLRPPQTCAKCDDCPVQRRGEPHG